MDLLEAGKLISKGDCVAFLGAGMSKPPANLWGQTVKNIATAVGITLTQAEEDDPQKYGEIVDRCISTDRRACDAALAEEFPKYHTQLRKALAHVLLLPFK